MNKKEADKRIEELEKEATKRYIDENTSWAYVLDCLSKDEKEELNECHKKLYGEDYPDLEIEE